MVPSEGQRPLDPTVQAIRRARLRALIDELDGDGVRSWSELGQILAVLDGAALQRLLNGSPITDELAREMEWAMHKPVGWMDGDHSHRQKPGGRDASGAVLNPPAADRHGWDLTDHIGDLIREGYLPKGSPAREVARHVMEAGERSLTKPQRIVYERSLLRALRAYDTGEPRTRIMELLVRDT